MGIKYLAQFVGNSKKVKSAGTKVKGFSAWPPKINPLDLGFVIYYDGLEGGVERATNYMTDLMMSGYRITDKVFQNGKN